MSAVCESCGTVNDADARACANCGANLTGADETETATLNLDIISAVVRSHGTTAVSTASAR